MITNQNNERRKESFLLTFISNALYFTASFVCATLLSGGTSQAQINVSPLLIEAQINKGQTQGVINIRNTSQEPIRARIYAEPFTYNRDTGFQLLPSIPNDLRSYLQFSPREVNIPPGGMRRVRLFVRLAPNLPDGEYRTMIFTEPLEGNIIEKSRNNSGNVATTITEVTTRIGSAFYVRKGKLTSNLVVDSSSWNHQTNRLGLLVRNTGTASIQANISWTLKQGQTVIHKGEAPATTILTGGERNIILPFDQQNQQQNQKNITIPPGTYQVVGKLNWGIDNKNTLPFNVNVVIPGAK
jgi:hypothetical protein